MSTVEAKDEILISDCVPSETIRCMYQLGEISKRQVSELLEWSGDDEYVSADEITRR